MSRFRRFKSALLLLPALCLILAYNNCSRVFYDSLKSQGIIVGNPMAPGSQKVLFAVCGVLSRCHPEMDLDLCNTEVLNTPGINTPLGLPDRYSTLSSIMQAEVSGSLSQNATVANACYVSVNTLDCSSSVVTAAYNPSAPDPFAGISNLLPAQVCSSVFSPPIACQSIDKPSYAVNDLGDATDINPGDHICTTATQTCTLRAALVEANADGSGTYDITVPSGTLSTNAALPVANNVRIFGDCAGTTVIDGQSKDSLFNVVSSNISIQMQSLKLQNGASAGSGGTIDSGANTNVVFVGSLLTFLNNKAAGPNGGGAVNWSGAGSSFRCSDCVFDSNQATGGTGEGGALAFTDASNVLERCLFANNTGSGTAGVGGVFDASGGTIYTNNTFYGNNGSAVYLNSPGAVHRFTNNTFVNNSAPTEGGAIGSSSVGFTVHMTNNLLYNNSGALGGCHIMSNIISHGGNLSYPSSPNCVFTHPTDLAVAPTLGPLQFNGGFSKSVAFLPGSIGIDNGINDGCPATDQRNYTRPTHGTCDIGAFEAQ